MPRSIDRRALRADLRARRRALPPRERLAAADAVATHLLELDALHLADQVAGYWAVDGEVSLHALLGGTLAERYCLPLIQPDSTLLFAPWRVGEPLAPNRFGIPEPATDTRLLPERVALVLLPLVGFDRNGARLGSGAGFYDRSFAFLRDAPRPARPLLVGVAYALQEVPGLGVEAWDVPLDYIATERELIRCER